MSQKRQRPGPLTVDEVERQRDWLLVSETFYTLQGEGPSTGRPAYFIRLGSCNLTCRWCDTPYTWAFTERQAEVHDDKRKYDPSQELHRISLYTLAERIHDSHAPLVVITGGEPMLQRGTVSRLISLVNERPARVRFEIETAGTVEPGDLVLYNNVNFNISPKLQGSGNALSKRFKPEILRAFNHLPGVNFKFVIDTRDPHHAMQDLEEVHSIVEQIEILPRRVWLMPCGVAPGEIIMGMRYLAKIAIASNWNLSGRQHVLIWNNERGH